METKTKKEKLNQNLATLVTLERKLQQQISVEFGGERPLMQLPLDVKIKQIHIDNNSLGYYLFKGSYITKPEITEMRDRWNLEVKATDPSPKQQQEVERKVGYTFFELKSLVKKSS